MAAVKSTRRRRSAMRSALISPASILDHLGATARFLDRRHRSLAERMRLDRQGTVQRARPQDFHRPAPDETDRAQLTRRHLAVGGKLVQGFQVHRGVFHPGEPARMADAAGAHSSPEGQPLGQNGLAAFKPRTRARPGTGGLTLPPATAVSAATRTQAPADAPAPTARPSCGFQLVDLHHSSDLAFRKNASVSFLASIASLASPAVSWTRTTRKTRKMRWTQQDVTCLSANTRDLFDRPAPSFGDVLWLAQIQQRRQRGPGLVNRIPRAQGFGQDVSDPRRLEHRAD